MEILNLEKLTDEKWLNLFAATFRHGGKTGRWVYASRNAEPRKSAHEATAVVIAPMLHEEGQPPRLVMIREFRVPIGDYMFALPAGLFEPGESLDEVIRREIHEETGLELVRVKRISPPLYSTAGLTDEAVALAFVDVRRLEGGQQKLEAGEEIEVCLLDWAQVSALVDSSVRIDAKAWCLLYHYQQLGRLE